MGHDFLLFYIQLHSFLEFICVFLWKPIHARMCFCVFVCVQYALNVKGKFNYGLMSCNVLFVLSDEDSDI